MLSIEPTPWDLQFTLFRIPVRVHPFFWLAAAVTGWNPDEPRFMVLWAVCLFVSILVHELGHALMAEFFRWPSRIILYHFGGLAISEPRGWHSPWRSIAVSLAGPGAGFLLYGLVLVADYTMRANDVSLSDEGHFVLFQLVRINLYWGLVNLLPVFPLDGGRVCQSLLEVFGVRNVDRLTFQIGAVVAGLVAAFFFNQRDEFGTFPAILFALLCFQNIQMLQETSRRW